MVTKAKKPPARRSKAKDAAAKKSAARPRARKPLARKRGPRTGAKPVAKGAANMPEVGGPTAVPGLSEEEQIREAKYLPREQPKRLFEEERFVFPETYGVNRVRLLVRDPEWIFAYWDVGPEAMKELARSTGERSLALSQLTLRIVDPVGGAVSDIPLPPGARWWYVRTDAARRRYRAELGVALPSGEFRRLAWSNSVVTPRAGPSPVAAARQLSYGEAGAIPLSAAEDAAAEESRSGLTGTPLAAGSLVGAAQPRASTAARPEGGASDTFGPGAGGRRPGASGGSRR